MRIASRHAEVVAALRNPDPAPGLDNRALHDGARALVVPADWDQQWEQRFTAAGEECEAVRELAEPMCLALAASVVHMPVDEARTWAPVAARLFGSEDEARAAAVALMERLHDALLVQAFAACAHSFAAFLGNAWLLLLEHPDEMTKLGADPALLGTAIEELLRLAGPSVAVFRPGLELRLSEANRDPGVFPEPDRLRLERGGTPGHVAFGAGPHACAGAGLIRQAARAPVLGFARHYAGRVLTFEASRHSGTRLSCVTSLKITRRC